MAEPSNDIMIAKTLLGLAREKTSSEPSAIAYVMDNIKWMAMALHIGLSNDGPKTARYLRTLADAMDPITETDTEALLDRVFQKR